MGNKEAAGARRAPQALLEKEVSAFKCSFL